MANNEVHIVDGKENMDIAVIHRFLSTESYWAKGISYTLVEKSLSHSFNVGAFVDGRQVGFGRVITDFSTFGWLADFFVLEGERGKGISKLILNHLFQKEWFTGLRRVMLNTSDAQGLYRKFHFADLNNPAFLQEIYRPGVHLSLQETES